MNSLTRLAALALLSISPLAAESQPPNVVIILADDLGNGDVSYNGCKDIPTPHIDRLAEQGVILTDAHTSASVCAPSRAGLMSGRYQQRTGFECNGPHGPHGLPGSTITFAEAMQTAGYQTMALGKWHLGDQAEHHPNAQGFDEFSGFIAGGRSYFAIDKPHKNAAMQRNGEAIDEQEITYVTDWLTDWLTDEAIRLIAKRDSSKPFFMYLSYNAPHTPMHALPQDLEKFEHIKNKKRRTYAAMVHNMDNNIGKLRAWLADQGLAENTMVIFTSDNGGATTNASDNGIYRGMKGSKWEGGHRVPCVISWPKGNLRGRKSNDYLTSTLDFMATSLAAAGAEQQIKTLDLDGINLLPVLNTRETDARGNLFWRRSVVACVRSGDWKLIRVEDKNDNFRYLMFNLQDDIGETKNLARTNPEKRDELIRLLVEWESKLQAPAWREGDRWEKNQRYKHRMEVVGRDAERKIP